MKKTILITGGAGFIGSNYINYKSAFYDVKLINLDKLTYASDLSNIKINKKCDYKFIEGDICDVEMVQHIFSQHTIDTIIHFAAESHVDNSINNPRDFINTNILGTFNLLQTLLRQAWKRINFFMYLLMRFMEH